MRVAHLVGPPTLSDLYLRSGLYTIKPEEAAAALLHDGAGDPADHAEAYAEVRERFEAAVAASGRAYPDYWEVEDRTAQLLYTLVRSLKPSLVFEIGVADGRSTSTILGALDANERGRLVSVDITADVGRALAGHPRWELRLRPPAKTSAAVLRQLLAEYGPPELFFHDAAHTYYDQYADYLAAIDHMLPGGVIVSDDVDLSWAFLDFTRAYGVSPTVLVDRRKATGALVRPRLAEDGRRAHR
ncbi:MAG TPA: class I SAM-dependent methyltransferase [Solirubrobacteraceae bacterium]|nr:class I SAM-dependent methyltransferase [Solirubrobacteraceae bacterium]